MVVTTRRLDVDRSAPRLGQAGEHVTGKTWIALEAKLGLRPPAEVDGRPRERVVHRHDRIAVASDPATVAEGVVERLPSASAASSAP